MVSSMFPPQCSLGSDRGLNALCSFWSYELCKQYVASDNNAEASAAAKTLLCGGIAGVVTWASIFPLGDLRWLTYFQLLRC
jgi:hypothetical protein